MTTIIFPTNGNALTAIKSSVLDAELLLPPPRKAPKIQASSSVRTPRDRDRKRTFRIVNNTTVDPIRPVLQTIRQRVELSIREILRVDEKHLDPSPTTTHSFESIFDDCRSTIILGHEGSHLTRVFETALNKAAQDVLVMLKKNDGCSADWLAGCLRAWDRWLYRLTILKSVLVFLDTEYLSQEGARSIWSIGLRVFSARVLNDPHITSRVQTAISDWLASEHESGSPHDNDQGTITRFIAMVNQLDHYHEHFAQPYLEWTATHYSEQFKILGDISRHSPTAIMHTSLGYLEEERVRAVTLMDSESLMSVEQTVLSHFVTPMQEWLAEAGVKEMSDARSVDGLYQLFLLFARTTTSLATYHSTYATARPALEVFRTALIEDATSRVRVVVTAPGHEGDARMVESLLSLRDFYEAFLKKVGEARTWVDAVHDAFAKGFSARKNKPAEMIAKSLDAAMRKGQKNATDEEFFVYLRRVLTLYRFSTDRDVFRTFYTRGLAKRLLLGRSASDDFEERVIKTLTDEYDDSFGDLRPMFKDIALSKDLTDEYCRRRANERPDPGLSVIVLQESVWPIVKKVSTADRKGKRKVGAGPKKVVETELRLPEKMELALRDYHKFYNTKHGNRVLCWAHYLGTATLTSHFPKGTKELSVSLYQATILLLFNEKTSWKAEEIQEATGFDDNDLTLTLQSLSLGQKRVLTKKGSVGKAVDKDDLFTLNEEFTDAKYRVHVNSIQQNESVEEAHHAAKAIDFNREASLDAAIVRIMKAKKTLGNTELVNLTIDAVKKHFIPQPADIKARLENLMERDFVKRKEGGVRTWLYVA